MKVFEDAMYEQDGYAIIGFINTQHDLECTFYEAVDGGSFPLNDIECSKEEFEDLLENELNDFMNNYTFLIISGHNIRIVTPEAKLIRGSDLDDEVYEISQSILDGNDCGEIFIESKKEKAFWKIV